MKTATLFLMLLISKVYAYGQKKPEDFGFKHLAMKFQNDPVDVIIASKTGEARIRKPLLFFCQGSLPQPVIKYDEKGLFGIFPFDEQPFLDEFHIAIVAKPFIPVIADANTLGNDFTYFKADDKRPPKKYLDRNFLDYYATRNNFIIKQLMKERWTNCSKVVVAGHSEGAAIAAKMAANNKKISHLIYSGGNPFGRIASVLSEARCKETVALNSGSQVIDYWKSVSSSRENLSSESGDSSKTTFDFSQPQYANLLNLTIPVLVTYGTKDWSSPYNDLLQIESIRRQMRNFSLKAYVNLGHNFFCVDDNRNILIDECRWDDVAADWLQWINENPAR